MTQEIWQGFVSVYDTEGIEYRCEIVEDSTRIGAVLKAGKKLTELTARYRKFGSTVKAVIERVQ